MPNFFNELAYHRHHVYKLLRDDNLPKDSLPVISIFGEIDLTLITNEELAVLVEPLVLFLTYFDKTHKVHGLDNLNRRLKKSLGTEGELITKSAPMSHEDQNSRIWTGNCQSNHHPIKTVESS